MNTSELSSAQILYEGVETRVFKAIHISDQKRVVVKEPISTAPHPRIVGQLRHEHRVLEMLAGVSGVVRLHSFVQGEHSVSLVMEDNGLPTLREVLLESGRMAFATGLEIAKRLARILADVHAANVIHKDINPSNILVDESANAVILIDFGIASCLAHETASAEIPEVLEGTLAYMSPEQTGRTARPMDARTDLYSLGVTLFEMFSGRKPFVETDPLAIVHAHLARFPPRIDQMMADIPPGLALIIDRLLKKNPEERYQTAQGLAEDLEHASREFEERGTIAAFTLGRKDFSPNLDLPQPLIGREAERAQISQAFMGAAEGSVGLLLVGGPPGIGKTTLVRSVYEDIARAGRGVLISGKHDSLARSTPIAALAAAFGGLLRQWLAKSETELESLRERIRLHVGPNARLIADVVPELDVLMGKIAPVAPVFGDLVLARQLLTWTNFVRVMAETAPPLVVFLDDIQWADGATFRILQSLLTDVDSRFLLVIATYRDNEVPPEHALWRLIEALEKRGATLGRISVGPLSEMHVGEWLARVLESSTTDVDALSQILYRKTYGNPFFLEQLLISLHRQTCLTRLLETGQWTWDLTAIERIRATDNVIALLSETVHQMPEDTQHILGIAACAGYSFRLDELTGLLGWTSHRVASALGPALRQELLVATSGAYRIAEASAESGGSALDAEVRFLHDRVKQASYEGLLPELRVQTHLDLGRRLLARYRNGETSPQTLLETVQHLALGAEAMVSPSERKEVAILQLAAARVTKNAGSYSSMARWLDTALALLGPSAPLEEPALVVELAIERIEAAFFLREFNEVEVRAGALLALPLPPLPRAAIHEIRLRACVAAGQFTRGVDLGRSVLAEMGTTFPETDELAIGALLTELGQLERWFDDHPRGFDEMPADTAVEHLLFDAITAHMLVCLGVGRQTPLLPLGLVRSVQETIRRGTLTVVVPLFIATLAHAISAITGDYRRAARWIAPAVAAAKRVNSPMVAECLSYQAIYVVYSRPYDESSAIHEEALSAGLALGSSQGTSWALLNELLSYRLFRGQPLPTVDSHRKIRLPIMQRAGDAHGMHYFELTECYSQTLTDGAHANWLAQAEPLARGSRSFAAEGDGISAEHARILESHLLLVTGQYTRALARAREAELHRPTLMGIPPVTNVPLWLSLAAAKCWSAATDDAERTKLNEEMENGLRRLNYFAEGCSDNFLHSLRLVQAEIARARGCTDEAMTRYDEAIVLARKHGFLHIEALAAQFGAEFHFDAGRLGIAIQYANIARQAYMQWGARAVVSHLEARCPTLFAYEQTHTTTARTLTQKDSTTFATANAALDLRTAMRASQALSSELHSERVVGRLMELLLENAGAQRGALFLAEARGLSLVARLSADNGRIETGLSESIDSNSVPHTVVQYVSRTAESVVTANAIQDARFSNDPYIVAHSVRSLLGLPLTHQGRLVGVIYLEHRDVPAAFAPNRVEFLTALAAQAAIAVENATIYRHLEAKVAERTAELQEAKAAADRASQAKSEFLSSMSHELRTPLNSILGYAQILERMPQLPSRAKEGVVVMRKSGEHLLTLINDVLDLAKIEAGKMDLVDHTFDFPTFMRTVGDICRVRAEAKNLVFVLEIHGPTIRSVVADERRLMQVLLNLIGNAIKFTQAGTIRVDVEVMQEHESRREVRIRVQDTGPGIASENIERIFAPFEQVGNIKARHEGTGLGLAITKKIVERMGGTLGVQSEFGHGSTFTVTLNLVEASVEPLQMELGNWRTIASYQGARRLVLVVDDNPDNRGVLRDLLVPIGFEVMEAEEGAMALEIAAKQLPALVIMDLAMPNMDGREATRRLRADPNLSHVAILASSASSAMLDRNNLVKQGFDDILPKPVQGEELFDKLQRLLDLQWVWRDDTDQNHDPVVVPETKYVAKLLELAKSGRIGNILQEADRIEKLDPAFAPWIEKLRALARSFRIKNVQEFLENQTAIGAQKPC